MTYRDPSTHAQAGYSIDEVMAMLGLCRQSVYNLINSGRLKTFKLGRRRFVSPHALDEMIRKAESEAA